MRGAESTAGAAHEPVSSGTPWVPIGFGLAVLAGLLIWAPRYARQRELRDERERIRSQLQSASEDLQEAAKAVDTRSELSQEQRLALYDRAVQARGDISRHVATLATRMDFEPSYELLKRVRDVAADVRGEERPSEIAARQAEAAAQAQALYAGQPAGAPWGQPMPTSGPGVAGAALAGLAAGVVAGELLSGPAHAASSVGAARGPVDDLEPFQSPPGADIDFGNDGGNGWDDASSADVGGDGGDFS